MPPPASFHPATHLTKSLAEERRCYRKRLARCQKKSTRKAVHKLRVETRRMLALLDLLYSLCANDSLSKMSRTFEKRLKTFGDLRDVQVQLETLQPLWMKFPEADSLKSFLERREKKLGAKLQRRIKEMKFSSLSRRLKKIESTLRRLQTTTASEMTASVSSVLEKSFVRVTDLRKRVQPESPATIHQMRIAFKRFRYLSELLQPVLSGITDEQIQRMKDYQSAAGHIQDLHILLAQIARTIKHRKINPANIRTLRHELSLRKKQSIRSFMDRIDDLDQMYRPLPTAETAKREVQL